MKKVILNDITHLVEDELIKNHIVPKGEESAEISLVDDKISVKLDCELENVRKYYILAYDKQEMKSLAWQKLRVYDKDTSLDFIFSAQFLAMLEEKSDFSYARLCLMCVWENLYVCFYLKDKYFLSAERRKYIGIVGNRLTRLGGKCPYIYLSKAGTLSISLMDIRPRNTENIEVSANKICLNLRLSSILNEVFQILLIAYDKKEGKCLAFQNLAEFNKTSVYLNMSKDFIGTLKNISNFRYARLGLLVLNGKDYKCFLLKNDKVNEVLTGEVDYIKEAGNVYIQNPKPDIILYFSRRGELSVKFIQFARIEKKNLDIMQKQNDELKKRNALLSQRNSYLQNENIRFQKILEDNHLYPEWEVVRTFIKNYFTFELKNEKLLVSHRFDSEEYREYRNLPLKKLIYGKKIKVPMLVMQQEQERILWIHEMTESEMTYTGAYQEEQGNKGVLCAFTNSWEDCICIVLFKNIEQLYRRFIHFQCECARVEINKRNLEIEFEGGLYSYKCDDFKLDRVELVIDANHHIEIDIKLSNSPKIIKKVHIVIPLESIAEKETDINNAIHINAHFEGVTCTWNIGNKREVESFTKYYYLPSSAAFINDKTMFVRKNIHQNYTLVVRPMDSQEKTLGFRIWENRIISCCMYHIGKVVQKWHRKNVNLYYEKNSMQADEGTYEIFLNAKKSVKSRNYFILDKHSTVWERLPDRKNVVRKYSPKYYWLLYTSDYFISTETSSHLNIHRAMNYYVRKALIERPLIFLQHGVTYLKSQGNRSVFGKGKEGEPTYIIVDSEKEAAIVSEMLGIEIDRCVKAGLPIFSTVKYQHIDELSDDIVTIMFTWKPSEEWMMSHFEESLYYKNTQTVYEMLKQFISADKIRIVPHPKVLNLLMSTDLAKQVWKGSVADALRSTKLLVTDYSSVCYNVFYQGAAVVFYQTDLEEYEKEVGKLIPKDDEYIGHRVFDEIHLKSVLERGIENGKIDFSYLRTEMFQERYKDINQFSDGKNVERIVGFLTKKQII